MNYESDFLRIYQCYYQIFKCIFKPNQDLHNAGGIEAVQ